MFEAYKIGITLSLVDNVSHGLSKLAKGFKGADVDAKAFQKRLDAIHLQLAKGTMMMGAGMGILHMFKAPIEEAKKYQVEATKLSTLGFGDAVNTQAETFARGMKTMGTSARENLTIVTDLMAVTKDLHHSKMVAPLLAQTSFNTKALYGEEGGDRDRKMMDAVKLLENRNGFKSEGEATAQLDLIQKAINGSRNRVDPAQILTAVRRGGLAFSDRTNEQMYLGSEGLIQDLGASSYGTAAMSLYRGWVQGKTTKAVALEMAKLGLIKDSDVGEKTGFKAGAMKGTDVLTKQGELRFLVDVLLPLMRQKGFIKDSNTEAQNDAAVYSEIGKINGDRTAAKLMATAYKNRKLLQEQYDANLGADGLQKTGEKARKTLAGKEVELQAKYHTLLMQLGTVALPMAIKGVEMLSKVLTPLSEFIEKHPTAATAMVYGLVTLAGVLVVGGIATNVAAIISLLQLLGGGSLAGAAAGAAGTLSAGLATAARGGAYTAAAAVGVAGGWYMGKWLGDTLGTWGAKKYYEGKDKVDILTPQARARMSAMQQQQKPGNTTFNVNLDGKQITSVVVDHLGKQVNRPDAGTSHPDYNQSMPRPAGGFSK